MKKAILILVLILSTGIFTACKEEKPDRMLLPSEVVTLEEAQKLVGDDYELVLKDDALIQEGNKITAKYIPEPLGSGDSVFVELYEPSENLDEEAVEEKFEASREKRTDFIEVKDLGDDAYIAYPTLHLYSNGVYVAITAGSEGGEEQTELLEEFGKVAEKNINKFFNKK